MDFVAHGKIRSCCVSISSNLEQLTSIEVLLTMVCSLLARRYLSLIFVSKVCVKMVHVSMSPSQLVGNINFKESYKFLFGLV